MRALLDVEAAIRELKKPKIAQKSLTFFEVQSGYRPGWTLASSFVLQAGAVALITFLALIPPRIARPSHLQFVNVIDFSSPDHVVFLPSVGGGSEGNRAGTRGNSSGTPTPPVRSSAGFSYPGPQATVSDPPDAFNPTQTLLQPALKDLPALHQFVPLPNVVQMAAAPDPAPARIVVKPSSRVETNDGVAPSVQLQPPKLALPLATVTFPAMALPDSLGSRKPVEKPIENPIAPPVELSESSNSGPDPRSLLSLSAIPAPPDVPAKFPHAEARGRFAVSPDPLALVSQPAPGAKSGDASFGTAGIGTRSDSGAADAAGTKDTAAGSEFGTPGGGEGRNSGLAKGRGTGDGGLGVTIGRGSGSGVGIGSGSSGSAASGGGAGNGGGSGTFAGITIKGGRYTGGTSADFHPTLAPRTAYGMTIVSTATSGGGLADFGVFSDEKVYTVFMDMRETGEEHVPAWTLQYAAAPSVAKRNGSVIVAPSPLVRPRPQLPTPLLHKYPHAMVVISAMLGTAGHLEDISVKQTPDTRLIPAILAALNNWYFRPAEMDGQPVPLKILLGIPLL